MAVIPMKRDGTFRYEEKGSSVLRKWNEERQLERAIAQRARKGMRESGFAGASISRLTASLSQWSGAVNADLDSALVILRSRARSLCANNEFARRFLSMAAANVVGPGFPKLQVRAKNQDGTLDKAANDAIETHFVRWCSTADIAGRMGFSHLLRVAVKSVGRDGEVLVRIVRDGALPYGIALQLLEPDRLDETINARLDGGNLIRMGVEVNSFGRPVAYWVKSAHPGENYQQFGQIKAERVLAKDIYHVFIQERPEQVRGYTWFHAVLQRMNMLHGYEEAAVVAARVGAAKMGVFVRKDDAASTLEVTADQRDTAGNLTMSAEAGEFVELPAGYELQSWNPEYPHANFESFLKQCLRGVASGLDVATHNLSGDMTDVNYSSARIAELDERDSWMVLQDWLFDQLATPIYKEWLASALIRGAITLEKTGKTLPAERLGKFMEVSRFQGRRWAWIDPAKEVDAALKAIDGKLTSRTEAVGSQGREFEDVIDEQSQEQNYMKEKGVDFAPLKPSPAQPAPVAKEEP